MGMYFFDFFDGTHWLEDTRGQEMGGLEDIAAEANEALVSLAPGLFAKSGGDATLAFTVRDDRRNDVLKATLTLRNEILVS